MASLQSCEGLFVVVAAAAKDLCFRFLHQLLLHAMLPLMAKVLGLLEVSGIAQRRFHQDRADTYKVTFFCPDIAYLSLLLPPTGELW